MFENKDRTEIEQLGEFGLIAHLTKDNITRRTETVKSIGDDAAILGTGEELTVVSTDMLVEGVHFDLTYVPLKHLGYKSIVVNLSDIYAMNAEPQHVTVSIAVSNRFSLEALEQLYIGIYAACEYYNVDVVGGDTTSSTSGLMISITAVGKVSKEKVTYRSGAKDTDLLCVTGDLGAAYMGLQILEREKQIYQEHPGIQPDLGTNDYILERQLKPEARKDLYLFLNDNDIIPTAMIDISDGLASELRHLCKASNVGCALFENKIPIDSATTTVAESLNIDPTVCALNGGEDYELLFTIKQADYDKLKDEAGISVIGHICHADQGMNMHTNGDNIIPIKAQGWDGLLY